jgi:GNAT superfamily N-acetyltransferase
MHLMFAGESLRGGVTARDLAGHAIHYRFLSPQDNIETITVMLHEAYAPLAAAGMRFVASHQDAEVTKRRLSKGETIVAVDGGSIVGIVTLIDAAKTTGSAFYNRPDVASFGQFAVRPSHQRLGIGSTLVDMVEQRAAETGVAELGLDTSEHAHHLIAFYEGKGYRFVEYCKWNGVNYRSMIFGKQLR